ncbi:MAG: hypothetical protein ACFBSE_18665 [Prochloraceae cyanobacterium]
MKKLAFISSAFIGTAAIVAWGLSVRAGINTFTGNVERVWEDGFTLRTEARRITVDSWDLCGDFTARHVAVGDRLTVTGEFERGEFDAFSIETLEQKQVCS